MKCQHLHYQKIETELGIYYKCLDCSQDFTHLSRKLQNLYIKQRFYQGQGNTYTSWLQGIYNTIQTGGIIYLILGGRAKGAAIWIFILAWFIQSIIETWIGWKDYNKWKMAQRQIILGASFSPITVETLKRIKNIEERLNPEYDKNSCLDKIK